MSFASQDERNAELVTEMNNKVWGAYDSSNVDKFFDERAKIYSNDWDSAYTVTEFKAHLDMIKKKATDTHMTLYNVISDDSFVAVRWANGSKESPYTGNSLFHVIDGKIVTAWMSSTKDKGTEKSL